MKRILFLLSISAGLLFSSCSNGKDTSVGRNSIMDSPQSILQNLDADLNENNAARAADSTATASFVKGATSDLLIAFLKNDISQILELVFDVPLQISETVFSEKTKNFLPELGISNAEVFLEGFEFKRIEVRKANLNEAEIFFHMRVLASEAETVKDDIVYIKCCLNNDLRLESEMYYIPSGGEEWSAIYERISFSKDKKVVNERQEKIDEASNCTKTEFYSDGSACQWYAHSNGEKEYRYDSTSAGGKLVISADGSNPAYEYQNASAGDTVKPILDEMKEIASSQGFYITTIPEEENFSKLQEWVAQ